jgi:hypothetical protein
LWSKGDGGRLGLLVAAGAGVIAASWFSAAGRPDAGDQMVFVSLSLLGALVGLAAVFGWVKQGRQAVGARTRLLLGSAPAAGMDVPAAGDLVAGPGATWFHRADCLLVDGRKVTVSPLGTHQAAGRRACGACKP